MIDKLKWIKEAKEFMLSKTGEWESEVALDDCIEFLYDEASDALEKFNFEMTPEESVQAEIDAWS